jgi:transcription-repair coupling factor (superfamily II helicase)
MPPVSLFTGIVESGDSWLAAELFSRMSKPVLVITNTAQAADRLVAECNSLCDGGPALAIPSRDAVAYSMTSPFGPTTEARLVAMHALLDAQARIYVAPARSLLQRVPAPHRLYNAIIRLAVGDDVGLSTLTAWLHDAHFTRERVVEDIGTFSVRGGIVDVYPFAYDNPLRIEFWGDTIESIREFDIASQTSAATRKEVVVYPMREFCFSEEQLAQGIERMRAHAQTRGLDAAQVERLAHQYMTSGDYEGIEHFLHWFHEEENSLLSYCKNDVCVVWDDLVGPASRFAGEMDMYIRRHENVAAKVRAFVSPPQELLLSPESVCADIERYQRVFLDTAGVAGPYVPEYPCSLQQQPRSGGSHELMVSMLRQYTERGFDCTMVCATRRSAQRIASYLEEEVPGIRYATGYCAEGVIDPGGKTALLSEHRLYNRRSIPRTQFGKKRAGVSRAHLDAIAPGDYVVHEDHGIGRFRGIQSVTAQNVARDCMVLQFAENAKLFVPIEDFHKVQKYIADTQNAPRLSKLGSGAWKRLKNRTREELKQIADELIRLYAKRKYDHGVSFSADTMWQREFEEMFPFEETKDQQAAIEQIKKDMEASRPMDRLICGDVGFGKTEVALRAAFKAVMDGFQVAVLVPTTILAAQHHRTFENRMRQYPVRIGLLSRFRSTTQQRETRQQLKAGTMDIVIGTHRLLSKDIVFANLGLLVIDEEQRFGVKHKEKIKQMRHSIDVLSMTATPIPRTLYMSLSGIRSLSLINSPPRNRLPIQTTVAEYHDELVMEALERELQRGGQVYFVHNRIQNLQTYYERLCELVPHARIITAHGQMDEQYLETVMDRFTAGEYDILLTTVIIENGLDITNVNTIIVNRADRMGLAQLYQLRGRVGRSSTQAYALFLTPPVQKLEEKSLRKLKAMEQYTELGSGFQIAMRDMEIRGMGNMLGAKQHGFIAAVGYDMYCKMLKESIQKARHGEDVSQQEDISPKVDVPIDVSIPNEYIQDSTTRVSVYQQLAGARSLEQVDETRDMMVDRFGDMPERVYTLITIMKIRVCARQLQITRVVISTTGELQLYYEHDTAQDGAGVMQPVLTSSPYHFTVSADTPLRMTTTLYARDTVQRLEETFTLLQACV